MEGFSASSGLTAAFTSTILLPVAGNAAEHASAVMFATKNRLNVSLGVAVGSSIQILVFVVPLLVILGWIGNVPLDLSWGGFELTAIATTVIISAFLLVFGKSYWLNGVILILSYAIIATAFGFHREEVAEYTCVYGAVANATAR